MDCFVPRNDNIPVQIKFGLCNKEVLSLRSENSNIGWVVVKLWAYNKNKDLHFTL